MLWQAGSMLDTLPAVAVRQVLLFCGWVLPFGHSIFLISGRKKDLGLKEAQHAVTAE